MSLSPLSRARFAALAFATLSSGNLVTLDVANAAKIDSGTSRGPARVDPGFGSGVLRAHGGISKVDSGPTYSLGKPRPFHDRSRRCHWVDNHGLQHRPGSDKIHVCN